MFNKLLLRQIQKHFGDPDTIPAEYNSLLKTISDSYDHYEKDRNMLEHSIVINSEEMIELNDNLRREKDELKKIRLMLEQRNKELEEFAYMASHDLQEPLRTTSNFISMLKKNYEGKIDEKADKYLAIIAQGTERMRALIKDLLEYSRVGWNQDFEKIDCTVLLTEVMEDVGMLIEESKAEIKSGKLPVINGTRTEIKQLFQNLLINAIKFRTKERHPVIEISAETVGTDWQFAFADNGIGISKEDMENIFVIFKRVHSRREYEGAGIGLAHCKKIVEAHNGRVWLASEPGKGSTFYFSIPQQQ